MQLTEEQVVQMSVLINEGKAGNFKATNVKVYGFLDWTWSGGVEGVDCSFEFRSFHRDGGNFKFTGYPELDFCQYVPQVADKLIAELKQLLEIT